jgi:hypothetical protein
MTSIHADTLNALDEMALSINYAARKQVLRDAERIIRDQESDIKELVSTLDRVLCVTTHDTFGIAKVARETIAKYHAKGIGR